MKGLNVRKLAAIAVGGALVGSALAPLAAAITLEKSDIVNPDTGAPVVNVVAGMQAQASDFVWAGNIAAKVAQLATVDAALEGGEGEVSVTDLSVDLTVGGESTYTPEYSYKYHGSSYPLESRDTAGALEFRKTLGSGQLQFLKNTTKSYRWEGSTYEIVVKETVGIEADARFDTHQDVKDLIVYLKNTGDMNYVLNLGEGIPCWATSTPGTAFTDGDNDNVVIPFLGAEYTVQEADCVSSTKTIKLIKESAKTNYNEGDTITGLSGKATYAGEEMSVKIAAITQSGAATTAYNARFELYDAEGNLVDHQTLGEGVYLNENFVDTTGDYALETVVYISTIRVEPTTSKGVITVIVGKDVVTLADGKQYPYDSTDTDVGNDYWKASLDQNSAANASPDVATIEKITVWNNVKKWDRDTPLWSTDDSLTQRGEDDADAGGNVAHFLAGESEGTLGYDFVKVQFDGFVIDQSLTTVKIGNNAITYTDNARIERTVPFYIALDNTATESTFTVDDQTFYYRCSTADANLLIFDNNYLNGARIDVNVVCTDWNVLCDQGYVDGNGVTGHGTCDLNGVEYNIEGHAYIDAEDTTTYGVGVYLLADGNCEFSAQPFANVDYLKLGGATNYTTRGKTDGDAFTTSTVYYDDDNANRIPLTVPLSVTKDTMNDTYKYRMYVERLSTSDGDIYLLLDNKTDFTSEFGTSEADVRFLGTDLEERGLLEDDIGSSLRPQELLNLAYNVPYYWPDEADFGEDSGDNLYIVAQFAVDVNTTHDANVYIDTATGDLVTLPNDQLSAYTSDVNFTPAGLSLNMRTDSDAYYQAAWIDYGTKIELTDDKETVTFTIPDSAIYLSLTVLGEGAEITTSGGDSVEGVKEGETATVDSTDVTVSAINYTAGTCTVADTTYPKIVSAGKLVVTDADARPAKAIIVGGYLVNTLAQNVVLNDETTLQEALISAGDKVVELLDDSGDIIVAGYTAADTGVAAQELIDALDALLE